jgi:hypothetical protein
MQLPTGHQEGVELENPVSIHTLTPANHSYLDELSSSLADTGHHREGWRLEGTCGVKWRRVECTCGEGAACCQT